MLLKLNLPNSSGGNAMSIEEKIRTILKPAAIAAALIIGIICEALGIHMLYKGTTIPFSVGLLLLIIGLVLIVLALRRFPEIEGAENPVEIWLGRNWLILIGIVLLAAFIGTHYQFPTTDKYRILADLVLIIIGITAAVGYGIYRWIWQNIKGRVETMAEEDRNVARAEVQTSLGYVWYQHYVAEKERQSEMEKLHDQLNEVKESLNLKHQEETEANPRSTYYLTRAIRNAEKALQHTDKLEETKHEELICRCKNNLAYYLAEKQRKEGNFQDKEKALELAKYAYRVAKKKRASPWYIKDEFYRFEETYAWVLWHFAEKGDEAAKQKAHEIINGLQRRTDLPPAWSKSISKAWADYF